MTCQLPITRISHDLLPPVEAPDAPRSAAVLRACRLARTDPREQVYALGLLVVGDQRVENFASLLRTYRQRLDGVGEISICPWHDSDTGVHVTVHQAQERQK